MFMERHRNEAGWSRQVAVVCMVEVSAGAIVHVANGSMLDT
jgi:hypothetical protein